MGRQNTCASHAGSRRGWTSVVFAVGRYCRRSDIVAALSAVRVVRRPRSGRGNNRSCACQSCGSCIQSFVTMLERWLKTTEESKAVPDKVDGNPGEHEQ